SQRYRNNNNAEERNRRESPKSSRHCALEVN
ncbi:MAG: hypothetical protein ACI88G_002137, partial [Woeseiaceae bacterium]